MNKSRKRKSISIKGQKQDTNTGRESAAEEWQLESTEKERDASDEKELWFAE